MTNPCTDTRCAAAGKCCCDKTHKYMTTNNEEVTPERMKEINKVVDRNILQEKISRALDREFGKYGFITVEKQRIVHLIMRFVRKAEREERKRILNYLKEHGHGGGNWRRLIELLYDPFDKEYEKWLKEQQKEVRIIEKNL